MKCAQHPRTGSATSVEENLGCSGTWWVPVRTGVIEMVHGVCTGRDMGLGTGRFRLSWEPCRQGGGGRCGLTSLSPM